MINDVGDGAAGTPDGGDDADEDKGDENIFYGSDTGKGQNRHFPDTVLSVQTVSEEQEKTKYQSD
jgi:hypothetical protein